MLSSCAMTTIFANAMAFIRANPCWYVRIFSLNMNALCSESTVKKNPQIKKDAHKLLCFRGRPPTSGGLGVRSPLLRLPPGIWRSAWDIWLAREWLLGPTL